MKRTAGTRTGRTRPLAIVAGMAAALVLGGCATPRAPGGGWPMPPPDRPMPPPHPHHDPQFEAALHECATSLGIALPVPPRGPEEGAKGVPPHDRQDGSGERDPGPRLSDAQRQQLDQCLAGKGFAHPEGAPPRHHDPKFEAALQECATSLGVALPPPHDPEEGAKGPPPHDGHGGPGGRGPDEHGPGGHDPGPRLSDEQRQQLDQCLAGKGFAHPEGAPPRHHDPKFEAALQECATSLGVTLPPPHDPEEGAKGPPPHDGHGGPGEHGPGGHDPGPRLSDDQRQQLDQCLSGKGFEPPAGPPRHHDPKFEAALQACAASLGLPTPPAGGHDPKDGAKTPPDGEQAGPGGRGAGGREVGPRLSDAQRQQLDQCLASKGFERPAGTPPRKPGSAD